MRWIVVVLAALTVSCGSPAIAPSPLPACQTNHTADLTLHNTSPTRATFEVVVDGVNKGPVAPDQFLGPFAVSADAPHLVRFFVANTATIGCEGTSTFTECTTHTLACNY